MSRIASNGSSKRRRGRDIDNGYNGRRGLDLIVSSECIGNGTCGLLEGVFVMFGVPRMAVVEVFVNHLDSLSQLPAVVEVCRMEYYCE